MIAHHTELANAPTLHSFADKLLDIVRHAAQQGRTAHDVERDIWDQLLALGRQAFAQFLKLQGSGDLGPQVTLSDGSLAQRLEQIHTRDYRTVFGSFTIERTCYGSREGQAITFVPLDNRLQLPESDYSYLLQQWGQMLGAESAFARVADTLEAILKIKQPVDSLERINRNMATAVEPFREQRPQPKPKDEGEVFVASADGKGIVMRRNPDDPKPKAHRNKGDKANKKRMAIVGAIYSVDRHIRTAEEVTAALFRDTPLSGDEKAKRPEPVGKHVWGRLSRAVDGSLGEPIDAVFGWQAKELGRRNKSGTKEVVCVMDGQECLWEGCQRHMPVGVVEVLDILHVTPRLWQAGHLFHKEGSQEAASFVRDRVLRMLRGECKGVVMGLRRQATLQKLKSSKKKRLETICKYLSGNASRMRYDEYLKKGYPIASGVIEGACRCYVKDRMERSGMRWTKAGAQAMLDVRSEYLNGDWDSFHQFRIQHETKQIYQDIQILERQIWTLAV
jgi:hypothetical protein